MKYGMWEYAYPLIIILLLRHFPPCVQLIELENRVEDHEVAALRLGAPEGVDREEQNVPLFVWDVNHCGVLRDLVTGFEQPRDQQLARVGVAQDHAGARRRRYDIDAVAELFGGQGGRLPDFRFRLFGQFRRRAILRHVRVVRRAAAREALTAFRRRAPSASAAHDVAQVEDRTAGAEYRQVVVVAIHNRACGVDRLRAQHTARDAQPLRRRD